MRFMHSDALSPLLYTRCKKEGGLASVLFHTKRHLQRAPDGSAARRVCAAIAVLWQVNATPQMTHQGRARREPPKNALPALRRLTREMAIACAPRLVRTFLGGSVSAV